MQEAVPVGVVAMAAILGLDFETVDRICREIGGDEVVQAANDNDPAQVVISGHKAANPAAAQELIVNDKVNFIAGFGVTPAALAAAPLATQAKIPEVVMAAGTSIITERSPYIVR